MKDCPMLAIKNELTMLNYWKEKHWKIIYSIDPIKLMLSNVELLKTIAKALLIMLNVDNHCWSLLTLIVDNHCWQSSLTIIVDNHCWQSLLTIIVDTCRSSLHWTNPSLQTCATVLASWGSVVFSSNTKIPKMEVFCTIRPIKRFTYLFMKLSRQVNQCISPCKKLST